ncbi:MAG TPA: hypothetical protein VKC66_17075, partial [Xanthobacteraceae bacterium]|nr:hypothetical protein [Xanthobacteraceae bacterium]
MSSCSSNRARRWFRTAQIRNLDVCEVVHEPGGVLAAAASGWEALSVPIKVERDMARLLSVNVGLPRDIEWKGRTVHTAIWKNPVGGRCRVGR